MRFLTFIIKNIVRRRFRSAFTIIGIAVAVGVVVALVGLSQGLESSLVDRFQRRGIDLVITRSGVSVPLTSSVDEHLEGTLRDLPDVAEVSPVVFDMVSFEQANLIGVIVFGWRPGAVQFKDLKMLAGRTLSSTDQDC